MQAYGTFTKIGDYIYRTDTHLQFGKTKDSKDLEDLEDVIGACVLCNPGSAKAFEDSIEKKLLSFQGPGNLVLKDVRLKEDATMKQLKNILEGIYGEDFKGIFRIYNLFTLKEPKMNIAIKLKKSNELNEEMLYKDFEDFNKLQLDGEKILLRAWGVDDAKILRDLKKDWDKLISNTEAKKLGKFKEESQYYHPLPKLQDHKIAFIKYIIDQYFKK